MAEATPTTSDATRHTDRGRAGFFPAVIAAMVVAAALRLVAAQDQFWMDEIWSYGTVNQMRSPAEVFTHFPSSNNHHFESLLMYFIGDQWDWRLYRYPSVLAGVLGAGAAAWIARRWGRAASVAAAWLFALSGLLVQYDSEARGYAWVMLFTLVSTEFLWRFTEQRRGRDAMLYGLFAVLGLLSHLEFAHVWLAQLAWSAWRLWCSSGRRAGAAVKGFAAAQALPAAFLAVFYVGVIRHIDMGLVPGASVPEVVLSAASMSFAGPERGAMAIVGAGAAVALLGAITFVMIARRCDFAVLLLGAAVVAPALVMLARPPETLFVRYFLTGAVLFLLGVAWLIGELFRSAGTPARLVAATIAVAFVLGNAASLRHFLSYGRGDYLGAMQLMWNETQGSEVVVASDHDSRNNLLVRFYARFMPEEKRLVYIGSVERGTRPAEWFIAHSVTPTAAPETLHVEAERGTFRLVGSFPHSALSGWSWYVYRRAESR